MSTTKVHPQNNKGRKQSVISNLIRGLTGKRQTAQVSPVKKNGEVHAETKAATRNNSLSFSTGSKAEETAPYNKGEIYFWRNFSYNQEGRPFLKVTHDSNMDDTGHVLTHEWKLGTPRIVLVVMSNVAPLNQWTNTRQIKNFQRGLIKAINTTEMWILTNGINVGISKIIGDAVQEELQKRSSKGSVQRNYGNCDPNPKIVLVGISREDFLIHGESFDGKAKRVEIENEGNRIEDQKFDLNPDHSHFVIVRDGTISKTGINYFLLKLQQYLATALEHPRNSANQHRLNRVSLGSLEIPVVAVLFQGGTDCARLVLDHLKRHLPLVVMKGSGGLADILGFAYTEISQRPQGFADAEFSENYLKPELSRKISEKFPKLRDSSLARNIFRDRILDCVRFARQNEQVYLTVLNIYEHNCNLENLGNHLLKSLFKSQLIDNTNWHAQMHKDLYLTLDWNSPRVAMSEVFLKDPSNKFKIEKDVFEEALLRPQRESFVDLFLTQGFQVHKYLTPRRLIMLFKKMRYQEFFQTVCWEGALGYGPVSNPSKNFIDTDLNWLIEKTTTFEDFVSAQELSLNAMGMYSIDPAAAERKAKALLTFWATFTNRIVLAKTLWKHADQPIHLALVLSMMIERLSFYANETSLKVEMEESSREFADIATSMLDACYLDAPSRAFDVLNQESPEWGFCTAVDIAAQAHNKRFLSHICCQKWLTNEFFGKIKIRDLTWGICTVPTSIKVLLCAFFIFPMYGWTVFQTKEYLIEGNKDIVDYDSDDESDDKILINDSSGSSADPAKQAQNKQKWNSNFWSPSSIKRYVNHHPPLWKMIYLMWSAPITKFWTFQMFYVVYLALFSIAVMWPSCGHPQLDLAVCIWTFLIALESVHPAVRMRKKYKAKAFILKILEIFIMFGFVVLYMFGRLIEPHAMDPYSARVILCLGLLYFYYRIIAIYLPISPTLGPLLYRVKLMVLVDFINFMRMAILVIISGGIVMHAIMFPDYPFDLELFRRTFHKAWFSLFMTPIDDLEGDPSCSRWTGRTYNSTFCKAGAYTDVNCPNVGLWAYLFTIQYFVLLKLILMTLLYALFSATASKLAAESDAIWKYQRYHLVVDFSNRLNLPAPLNIISYIMIAYQFIRWILCCMFCSMCRENSNEARSDRRHSITDYTYWNQLAQEYDSIQQTKEMERDILENEMDLIRGLMEDFVYQKQMIQSLKTSVRELERLMNYSHVHLENIRHLTNRDNGVSVTTWDNMQDHGNRGSSLPSVMNILSRRSPYPGTQVQRYPVPDKYVPWEVMWIGYDPVAFTQQRQDFPVTLQSYVDEDILFLREKNGPHHALPVFAWNSVSVNPAGIGLDRQSWITGSDGSPFTYKLDCEGIPQNPRGRTGLRGRGALPRWGPNHYMLVIITRYQKARESSYLTTKGLEFVVLWTERRFQLSIPGGFVSGEHRYEVIRSMFKPQHTGNTAWIDSKMVIEFFRSCIVPKQELAESTDNLASSFKDSEDASKVQCDLVSKGYMDDPCNTDHAWKEMELWHVHYNTPETIAEKLQVQMGWRLITEDAFFKLPAGQAVLLQDIAKKMKATIL